MRNMFLTILIVSLWGPFSLAASGSESLKTDSFSLSAVLGKLGYGPYSSSRVPIQSEDDLVRAIRGETPRIEETHKEFFWPFPELAVSPDLSVIAVSMDERAFPGKPGAESRVALISIPERPRGEAKLIWTPAFEPGARVKSVDFMTDNLIRVGVTSVQNGLEIGYATNYHFFDVTNNRNSFSVAEDLGKKDRVVHVRHFSNDIYVVAFGDSYKLRYELVSYDPLKRKARTIMNLPSDRSTLVNIMHGVIDAPGRDVWRQGDGNLQVRFSKPVNGEYQRFVLEVTDGMIAQILPEEERDENLKVIEGTDLYLQRNSEDRLEILTVGDDGNWSEFYSSDEVSPWQRLRKVTKGIVGTEAHMNENSTYLYEKGKPAQMLWSPRLIKDAHLDGGFVGLEGLDPRTGAINVLRVIYDEKTLLNSATLGMEEASACTSLLLNKIMSNVSQAKKGKKKK